MFGKKKKTVKKLLCLFLLLTGILLFGCLQVHAATPYAANGKLSVKGSQIVNSKGKSFVIQGVSTHGLAWFPEYVNKAAFKTLRDEWGVNTIRLAMYTAEYNGYCTGGTQNQKNLKKLIDQGVSYATELGMYVIIDWHILSDGNPRTCQTQANAFFKETAKKYAGYGNVLYEICNEPNGGQGTWKNIKSYANAIIKTIRSVNKDAVIIVGTPTWSQDVDTAAASKITGCSNIAYAFHFYAGTHKADMRTKLENTLKKGLPVIVTEFGISEASGNGGISKTEGNAWIRLLEQYHVGRVCWNLSNKNESCALLKASCSKKSGWNSSDLSTSGKWLKSVYTANVSPTVTVTPKPTATPKPAAAEKKKVSSTGKVKLNASIQKVNSWKSGSTYYTQYKLVIKNIGSKASAKWAVVVKFSQNVKLDSKWCASFSKNKTKLTIKPLSWNKKIAKKGTTEIGFITKSSKPQSLEAVSITAS